MTDASNDERLTLRDRFAIAALGACNVNPNLPNDPAGPIWPTAATLAQRRATWAYLQADAMLKARGEA